MGDEVLKGGRGLRGGGVRGGSGGGELGRRWVWRDWERRGEEACVLVVYGCALARLAGT